MEAFEAIEASIGRLNRLGVTIRQASKGNTAGRVNKFASTLQLDPFKTLCALTLQSLYPDATGALRDRLNRYMTNQFAAILFAKSRQETLQSRRQEQMKPAQSALSTIRETSPLDITNQQATSSRKPFALDHQSMPAQSDRSSLDTKLIRKVMKNALSIESHTRRTSSVHMGHLKYPPKPSTKDSKEYFTCEWCSRRQFDMSEDGWRLVIPTYYSRETV